MNVLDLCHQMCCNYVNSENQVTGLSTRAAPFSLGVIYLTKYTPCRDSESVCITPEMLEAGAKVVRNYFETSSDSARWVAESVFRDMVETAQAKSPK